MVNYKLISLDKIPSTQTYAHDLIAAGTARDHTAVTARTQTAGRGRYRRTWVSNAGNLYVSFILHCARRDPRLSYAVAVAIAETLMTFGVRPTIKWPNDILIDGKKICGVLIEYNHDFVVIGIGINVQSNPNVENYQTARLADCANTDVDVPVVLGRLMRMLDKWMTADFPDVRARWMELAAGLNGVVKYRGECAQLIGINEAGALMLRRAGQDLLAWGDEIIM
ncbi:MAG: biotin--[acetyl-CoA-carboxylase] ligase [Alphaproteobacteria bacterium]|nr:biotin--[acetyl-CoA-carboxylase] ligase [Alphaproteobacteria bacterium]